MALRPYIIQWRVSCASPRSKHIAVTACQIGHGSGWVPVDELSYGARNFCDPGFSPRLRLQVLG